MQKKDATIDQDAIKFYKVDHKYGQFSNFYKAVIAIDSKTWPTTEHYFQAQKFAGKQSIVSF